MEFSVWRSRQDYSLTLKSSAVDSMEPGELTYKKA